MRFFLLFFLFACLPLAAFGEMEHTSAAAAVLIESKTARVLYGKNENELLPMASTTKIMTALLTLENCDLSETVTASENASGVPGTSIYLGVGETLTVEQLLYGLLLRSGNDAAVALGEHVANDIAAFAEMMNERAQKLRADAHFINPHGLDANGHCASALAMALIAREVMEYPVFRSIVSTKTKTIPWHGNQYDRVLTNKNKLLTNYPNSTGIKTGFTEKAGRCLVFSAKRDGMELIGVVLNCHDWFNEAKRLLDWGFSEYRLEALTYMGQSIAEIEVNGGMTKTARVVSPRPLLVPLSQGENAELIVETETSLEAPLAVGTVVGVASAVVNGEVISTQPLVIEKSVDRRTLPDAFMKVLRMFNPVA